MDNVVLSWTWAGERGICLRMAEAPSPETTRRILGIINRLRDTMGTALLDVAPAYTTLTVFFDTELVAREQALEWLLQAVAESPEAPSDSGHIVRLPVYYSAETGPDLNDLAREKGLAVTELIALHSGTEYYAYANGFAPGFCYLGEVPQGLAAPRLATPRRSVPAGSVGIADRQTAVYPSQSPGGWRLIGRCPLPLFNLEDNPPTAITVGDRVLFEPIDKQQFLSLGGVL